MHDEEALYGFTHEVWREKPDGRATLQSREKRRKVAVMIRFQLCALNWCAAVDVGVNPTGMAYHLPLTGVKPVTRRVRNHRSGHALT